MINLDSVPSEWSVLIEYSKNGHVTVKFSRSIDSDVLQEIHNLMNDSRIGVMWLERTEVAIIDPKSLNSNALAHAIANGFVEGHGLTVKIVNNQTGKSEILAGVAE